MDANEKKRKRERYRYAHMSNEKKIERIKRNREEYANMQPEQKAARIQKITENKEFKRRAQTKYSIALPDMEVRTSTFDLNQRKHVTPGERQTLLHRRNEEFTRKIENAAMSSKEGTSKLRNGDDDRGRPHLQAIINGNTIII
jgi:hypothetical protein